MHKARRFNSKNLSKYFLIPQEKLNCCVKVPYSLRKTIKRQLHCNNLPLKSFEWKEMVYTTTRYGGQHRRRYEYTVEFLISLKPLDLSYHRLILCVDTPVRLLRNLKPQNYEIYTTNCNGCNLPSKSALR